MKGIIFDLDGTLVNTGVQLTKLCNDCFAMKGVGPVSEQVVLDMLGEGPRRLLEKLYLYHGLPMDDFEVTFLKYQEAYKKSKPDIHAIYPEMRETLEELKHFYKLGVCTNKPEDIAKAMMKDFFPGIFDMVVGTGGAYPRKPNPTGALAIGKKWNIAPKEIAFVGDTKVDIETGKAAGMKTLAVTWGFRSEENLKTYQADLYVHKPKDLWKKRFLWDDEVLLG